MRKLNLYASSWSDTVEQQKLELGRQDMAFKGKLQEAETEKNALRDQMANLISEKAQLEIALSSRDGELQSLRSRSIGVETDVHARQVDRCNRLEADIDTLKKELQAKDNEVLVKEAEARAREAEAQKAASDAVTMSEKMRQAEDMARLASDRAAGAEARASKAEVKASQADFRLAEADSRLKDCFNSANQERAKRELSEEQLKWEVAAKERATMEVAAATCPRSRQRSSIASASPLRNAASAA